MNKQRSPQLSRLVNRLSGGRIKYGWYSSAYQSTESPIVVGGCPRSGTTLLYALLNAHSDIFLGIETGLFTANRRLAHLRGRTGLELAELERLYRRSTCYPEFAETVLKTLAEREHKQRWGDKSPVNVTIIDALFAHFPNARFIHAVRDGRDAVCSIRTHPPSFGNKYEKINPWKDCVERWNHWTRAGHAHQGDPRYIEVRYEDLVSDTEQTLRGLLDWLGEPWEAGIVEKARGTSVSSHPQVKQPINLRGVGRWRTDLPLEARQLFLGAPGLLLQELGYADDPDWVLEQ